MAFVKMKDIPFDERYVLIMINDNVLTEAITYDLRLLYEFIDKHAPEKSHWKFGKAYRMILRRAKEKAGYRKYIISKRQVASLINVYKKNNDQYIKIPFASEYIFYAIFSIFEEFSSDPSISIPQNIKASYGRVRREVFYKSQSNQYEYDYKHGLLSERPELEDIRKNLLNDICSEECSLGKDFSN